MDFLNIYLFFFSIGSWSSISGTHIPTQLSPRKSSQRVTFEIVSAKTVTDSKKKYVVSL